MGMTMMLPASGLYPFEIFHTRFQLISRPIEFLSCLSVTKYSGNQLLPKSEDLVGCVCVPEFDSVQKRVCLNRSSVCESN